MIARVVRFFFAYVTSMGPRSDNRGYAKPLQFKRIRPDTLQLGPRSDNRGYVVCRSSLAPFKLASMGPRSDNRGYVGYGQSLTTQGHASMGPRSDNRGYAGKRMMTNNPTTLQWVHGPITVVMNARVSGNALAYGLQWVHGPITVVMKARIDSVFLLEKLQWVHGPITVVMDRCLRNRMLRLRASMGPRSDNRGYGYALPFSNSSLPASMGPRSDNRGYGRFPRHRGTSLARLQWVHGPITVVMMNTPAVFTPPKSLQWVHGPITVVMVPPLPG